MCSFEKIFNISELKCAALKNIKFPGIKMCSFEKILNFSELKCAALKKYLIYPN